jgi:hypothetical protein
MPTAHFPAAHADPQLFPFSFFPPRSLIFSFLVGGSPSLLVGGVLAHKSRTEHSELGVLGFVLGF